MIYFKKIIIFFIVFSTTIFSQKRVVEENKEVLSSRNSSLLQVDAIPLDLMESFIEENLFGFCVDVYDLNIIASNGALGGFSYSGDDFGITQGVILSTGKVENAVGPNNSTCISSSHATSGDPILNTLNSDLLTFDACIIEFDFIAASDNLLACEFIFASEEYPEYVDSWFNDIFGFFISEPYEIELGDIDPNISLQPQNLAFLPNSEIPISINNINENENPNFYIDNSDGENIQYDGFTTPISLEKEIKQGVVYRLRIAIADGSDDQYDSALFLKSNSFESGVNAEIGNVSQNGLEVSFENNSLGSQFFWDFGDGLYSNLENPIHQYDLPGTYIVTLNVLDDSNCGTSQTTQIITVSNIEQISVLDNEKQEILAYFNSDEESIIINGLDSNNSYYVNVYNAIGQKELSNIKVELNTNKIKISQLSSGPYFVELRNEKFEDIFLKKVLIY
tara:strand:- start:1332 stop:2681 length:1350 start_codon:yes stop_codon:yes gene_type:complete